MTHKLGRLGSSRQRPGDSKQHREPDSRRTGERSGCGIGGVWRSERPYAEGNACSRQRRLLERPSPAQAPTLRRRRISHCHGGPRAGCEHARWGEGRLNPGCEDLRGCLRPVRRWETDDHHC